MKRKMTMSLALSMVLILLGAAALAWGLTYSPKVSAQLAARNAVMEKYGLSLEAMEMFGVVSDDGGKTVRLWLTGEIDNAEKRAGTYTVTFDNNGKPTASWTHDDADPATYADGSLDSEVWGPKQIAAYRAKRDAENRAFQEEWQRLYGENGTAVQPTKAPTTVESPQGTLTQADAVAIAGEALRKAYGLTDEGFALFRVCAGLGKTEKEALAAARSALGDTLSPLEVTERFFDGYASTDTPDGDVWVVLWHPDWIPWLTFMNAGSELGAEPYTPLGAYVATVSDQTGEALRTAWSMQGQGDEAYTDATWGKAKAYRADMLGWVAALMRVVEPLEKKYENTPGAWSVEDQAAYDQAFRDAGFDAAKYDHVLPEPGEISYQQALDIAAQVFEKEYGVSRAVFDASGVAYGDLTQEGDRREWYFWVQNTEAQCSWSIVLDAKTGEVLQLYVDPYASGNG